MSAEKESFASRWSRRKQEVANEIQVDDISIAPETPVIDEEMLEEQRLEKLNALTDKDMPDIETLNEDSDFSGFMSTGVSETLRKIALQKLFHGKSYNVRDGLDEYDGDYTSFEKLDPSVITCDMKHLLEVEAEKLLAEKEEAERLEQAEIDEEALEDELDNLVTTEINDTPEALVAKTANSNIKNNESETGEEMILINPLEEGLEESQVSNKKSDTV